MGTKGKPSAVPPAFVQNPVRTFLLITAEWAVPISGAAPGRTKRHDPGRLSAGGLPSLRTANTLYSRSTHCNQYLYHKSDSKARGKEGKERENAMSTASSKSFFQKERQCCPGGICVFCAGNRRRLGQGRGTVIFVIITKKAK